MKKNVPKLLFKSSFCSMIGALCQVLLISLASTIDAHAQQFQSAKEVAVTIDAKSTMLIDVLKEIEHKTELKFVYDKNADFLFEQVEVSPGRLTVENHLTAISHQKKLGFRQVNNTISVKQAQKGQRGEVELVMQSRTITGTITSSEDNSGLPGVSVLIKGTTTGHGNRC